MGEGAVFKNLWTLLGAACLLEVAFAGGAEPKLALTCIGTKYRLSL